MKMLKIKTKKIKEDPKIEIRTSPDISEDRILKAIGAVLENQNKTDDRLNVLEKKLLRQETGKDDRFKEKATEKDIEVGKASREGVDPRIVKIIDNILGEDFSVKIETELDRPGFRLDIIVPQRLSLLEEDRRPSKQSVGETIWETYQPLDIRSRQIASMDSFDVIKTHCERVRANIVSTYQKLQKPLPEFKLK